ILFVCLVAWMSQGAEIETLQQKLKGLGDEMRKSATVDQELSQLRKKLPDTTDPAQRKAVFTEWRNKLSERIEKEDRLSARITEALAAAKGLPTDQQVDTTS